LIGLKKNLKILEDVVDVMAQTKWLLKDTTHINISVKRFKELTRAPKKKKKIKSRGLDSKTF
jgi:hypothetical protein